MSNGATKWLLAVIQSELHARAETLRWVLGLPSRRDFGKDPVASDSRQAGDP